MISNANTKRSKSSSQSPSVIFDADTNLTKVTSSNSLLNSTNIDKKDSKSEDHK